MQAILLTLALVSLDARSLVQPSPYPQGHLRCTYSGFLPGSTDESQWVQESMGQGRYVLEVQGAQVVLGILRHDLGEQAERVLTWSLDGRDPVGGGPLGSSRYQLRADVAVRGGGQGRYTATVDTETVCPGMPRDVRRGDSWTCREKTTAGWRWEVAGRPPDSGEERSQREVSYTYLDDESALVPDGAQVQAAVIESRDPDGGHEKVLVDPAAPWCPLRTERLKLGRVVGTDRLVAREMDAPAVAAAPAAPARSWDMFFGVWLLGGLGVCVGVVGIILVATRKRTRA